VASYLHFLSEASSDENQSPKKMKLDSWCRRRSTFTKGMRWVNAMSQWFLLYFYEKLCTVIYNKLSLTPSPTSVLCFDPIKATTLHDNGLSYTRLSNQQKNCGEVVLIHLIFQEGVHGFGLQKKYYTGFVLNLICAHCQSLWEKARALNCHVNCGYNVSSWYHLSLNRLRHLFMHIH